MPMLRKRKGVLNDDQMLPTFLLALAAGYENGGQGASIRSSIRLVSARGHLLTSQSASMIQPSREIENNCPRDSTDVSVHDTWRQLIARKDRVAGAMCCFQSIFYQDEYRHHIHGHQCRLQLCVVLQAPEQPEDLDDLDEAFEHMLYGDKYWRQRDQLSANVIAYAIAVLMAMHAVCTAAMHLAAYQVDPLPTALEAVVCLRHWTMWPMYFFYTLYQALLMPVVLALLAGYRDAFGMRRELLIMILGGMAAMSVNLATLCFLLSTACYLLIMHGVGVVWPVYMAQRLEHAQKRDRDELTRDAFETMLADVMRFEAFKMFTVRDFSAENALFYERCRRLRNTASSMDQGTRARELQQIWNTFIRPAASLQVHLDARTLDELRGRVRSNSVDIRILDGALSEVCELMYQHTYPRVWTRSLMLVPHALVLAKWRNCIGHRDYGRVQRVSRQ
ncbi:hypothetical protein THASP1DRAFT_23010 [Thamnocephalis sphaerospora]|uniref:RGS domain-containing protein n=1 Tax=Thamnocephalis sphaerospora TaxID=78915 RepID=A0A4P9XSK6_9FUNG|nr:hypothetical protein THASP1DRAFT_23010 [Thamnocephalis sphaerospora]|eukprot:RKP09106.1 hypothetical protein THASP1DRAFT_23010 [Thamnocephalis sphaerospora]